MNILLQWHVVPLSFTQKSYWCGTVQNNKDDVEDDQQWQQEEYFEKDPLGMKAGIRIKDLRKVCIFHSYTA